MSRPAFWTVLLGFVVGLTPAALADPVEAVVPSGNAVLIKCREWLLFRTCKSYDRIELPRQITVGDRIDLRSFGSSPKDYIFHVVEIRRKGEGCLLLSELSEGREDRERIVIPRCEPVAKPAAGVRSPGVAPASAR